MPRPSPVRLEFGDDLFARGHRGVGTPVVSQRVWRLRTAYDAGRLCRVAEALAHGRLSRRVQRALVPGARDAWLPAPDAGVVALGDEMLPAGDVLGWLAARHRDPIDPHDGPSWRLSATDLDDGGAVVSLTVAHAVGDGASITEAVRAAVDDPDRVFELPAAHGLPRLGLEATDAVAQVAAIGGWARARVRATRAGTLPARTSPPSLPVPGTSDADDAGDWTPPRVVAELDTAAVAAAAARHQGSANAWFLAVAATVLDRIGHAVPGASIPVSVPVSGFTPGDPRANSTRIARVDVDRDALAARDLAHVKRSAKDAYARLRDSGPGLAPIPLPLIQMLPDGMLRRVPQPPQAACLASNLGTLSDPVARAMGEGVRAVATSAGPQRLTADEARAVGGGLLLWYAAVGPRSTLTLIPAEPDRVPDAAAFRELVVDELASWDVPATLW